MSRTDGRPTQGADGAGRAPTSERPGNLQGLDRARRRRLVGRSLTRSLLSVIILIFVYYVLPLDRPFESSLLTLIGGMLLFGLVLAWQIAMIVRADYPALRAVEGLSTAIPLFLLLFAAAYFEMAHSHQHAFTEPLTRTDALYFTVTVFATVGFGDIAPVIQEARIAATVQMVLDLLIIGVLVRAVFGLVRATQEHRDDGSPTGAGDGSAG
ncbi:MAG TPA: potassium channel family protein [Micromonosporaceae bacterium]